MDHLIDFSQYQPAPDIDSMDRAALLDYLNQLRSQIEKLDAAEPADMDSETYEAWGDEHEELEDLVDEILDRLDELK